MTLRLYMIAADTVLPLQPTFHGLPRGGLDAALHIMPLKIDDLYGDEICELICKLHDIAMKVPPQASSIATAPDDDPDAWRAELEQDLIASGREQLP